MKNQLDEMIMEAYEIAIINASVETGIIEEDFPMECPYDAASIMADTFWPS